jgi:putative copper resistance protein D
MNAALVGVRAVYFIAALQLFGWLIFDLFIGRPGWGRRAAPMTAVALIAMTAWLVIETNLMSGEPVSAETLGIVLRETQFGTLWIWRAVLLIALSALTLWRIRLARFVAALGATLVLILTASAGHGGADGSSIHLAGDAIHLLAVGAWLGGLVPFAVAMRLPDAGATVWRFSTLGVISVCIILATGAINAWFLVGNSPALIGTPYGRVLLVKIALFCIMVAVAAVNRFCLTPRGDLAALRRNAQIEAALGVVIIVIVAVLGTMPPAYGAQN